MDTAKDPWIVRRTACLKQFGDRKINRAAMIPRGMQLHVNHPPFCFCSP